MALTAHERRQIRDYLPPLSDRPPGFDLAGTLDTLLADLDTAEATLAAAVVDLVDMKSGTADVAIGASTVAVVVGAAYDGKPAIAVLNFVDATATEIRAAVWNGTGTLTISVNANATAATKVSWMVDGR